MAGTYNVLSSSSIFLSIMCGLLVIASICLNFTFLVILLKTRRLYHVDKSNNLVTSMILVDFIATLFILIPAGYGVYNDYTLNEAGCHCMTWFSTFFLCMTFQGMCLISIERFLKYHKPIWHINFFTKRIVYDEIGNAVNDSASQGVKVFAVIASLWLLNIFIAFIPNFANFKDQQYFYSESQCDYIYEKYRWWLWIYFLIFVTAPFLASLIFFFLALKEAASSDRIVRMKSAQFKIEEDKRRSSLNERNMAENVIEGLDITLQPGNKLYYAHILDYDRVPEDLRDNETNDFHVRDQLLMLFKYDSERGKLVSFIIITIVSYVLVFPMFVLHFTRAYNNGNRPDASGNYDDPNLINGSLYTAFVWISYLTLIVKAFFCIVQNKFYRHAFYQSANIRGFKGYFDFENQKKAIVREFDSAEDKLKFVEKKITGAYQNHGYKSHA